MRRPGGSKGDELVEVVPGLVETTERVLYDQVWERPELSMRDRSLVTIAALVSMYRPEQLPSHLKFGLDNGLTREEIGEALHHLAFYASWPSAISASRRFYDLCKKLDEEAAAGTP